MLSAPEPIEAVREAEIRGVVELREGCFVITMDGDSWLIEWPHGSTLGDDLKSVEVPDFGTVRVGDMVNAGGGYASSHDGCDVDGVEGTAGLDTLE